MEFVNKREEYLSHRDDDSLTFEFKELRERIAKTQECNVYTTGVDDAERVKKLVRKIKKLEKEVKFWKKLSRGNTVSRQFTSRKRS